MIPPPPRSTRTDTLFPYPTLFRSTRAIETAAERRPLGNKLADDRVDGIHTATIFSQVDYQRVALRRNRHHRLDDVAAKRPGREDAKVDQHDIAVEPFDLLHSSEERRVGKECVSQCRSRLSRYP